MKTNTSYAEFLRHENELTKLKIKAEFGVDVHGNQEMNPAIENIWLNNILEYERSMTNNKRITIHEYLGFPSFRLINDINDESLPFELQTLLETLRNKSILVESCSNVSDREMYRFITEELFKEETDTCVPKNMLTCFIYEEFHPDDDYDLRRYTKDFIDDFVNKETDHYEIHISSGFNDEDDFESENLKRRLKLFRDAFDEIRIKEMNIKSVNVMGDESAEVIIDFSIAVLPPGNTIFQHLTGPGKIHFKKEFGYWYIDRIEMEGVI